MNDSLAKHVINTASPSTGDQYYVFIIALTIVAITWLILYYRNKKGGAESDAGQRRNQSAETDVYRLHPEDRARLERLEESVRTLAEAFRGIVHERGELMEKIGELRGRVMAKKESGD